MKITQNEPARLVIVSRPWVTTLTTWMMGATALAAAVAGAGMAWPERLLVLVLGIGAVAIAWRLMPFTTLIFDRAQGRLTRVQHRVTGTTTLHIPLDKVERALCQSTQGEAGGAMERLAVVVTGRGQVPMETGYWGIGRHDIAHAINAWLDAGRRP